MGKQLIGNRISTFSAADANTTYILAQGSTITSTSIGIQIAGPGEGREVVVNGRIDSQGAAVQVGDILGSFAPAEVHVGKTGVIDAEGIGIYLRGIDHLATNAGSITGQTGIMANDIGTRIVNSGSITADFAGIGGGGGQTVINSGSISGAHGIYMTGDYGDHGMVIRNSGTVTVQYTAIYGSPGDDRVVNTGTLGGDVILGEGGDHFTMKAGTLDGFVDGGQGDDVYVIGVKGVEIHESVMSGFDTVRSGVSFTLGNEIEKLVLTGSKDINGNGGATANTIIGNAGDNILHGGDLGDMLAGGAGRDRLYGDAGADIFVFARGSGRDTVMDYADEMDRIDLSGLDAIGSFTDLMKHHVSEHGKDVWITAGDDVLVVRNTDASAFDQNDFVW